MDGNYAQNVRPNVQSRSTRFVHKFPYEESLTVDFRSCSIDLPIMFLHRNLSQARSSLIGSKKVTSGARSTCRFRSFATTLLRRLLVSVQEGTGMLEHELCYSLPFAGGVFCEKNGEGHQFKLSATSVLFD